MKTMSIILGFLLPALAAASATGDEVRQEATFGYSDYAVNHPEARFREYRSMPRGFVLREYRLGYQGRQHAVSGLVKNLRLGDQLVTLDYRHRNGVTARTWWDRVPHTLSLVSATPYAEHERGHYVLSDEIQRNAQSSDTAATRVLLSLADVAQQRPLELSWEKYGSDMSIPAGPGRVSFAFTREKKHGSKAIGAPLGFNLVTELPEPVDYNTDTFTAGATGRGTRWVGGVDYTYRAFTNHVDDITWDSPRRLTDATSPSAYTGGTGASQGQLDLYPDNRTHQVTANATLNLPMSSLLTGMIGWSRATQTDSLLPYTINTAITTDTLGTPAWLASSLPVARMDALRTVLTQRYLLDVRPWARASARLEYRANKVNNRTPVIVFPGQVRMDQVWEAEEIHNHPYDSDRRVLTGFVTVRPESRVTLEASGGREIMDRTLREVKRTNEDFIQGQVRARPIRPLQLKATYLHARRRMEDFEIEDYQDEAGHLIELPGLRRADVADRDRDRWTGWAGWSPSDGWIVIGVRGNTEKSTYKPGKGDLTAGDSTFTDTMYGLLEARRHGGTADVGFDLGGNGRLNLLYDQQYTRLTNRSNVSGSSLTQNAVDDWTAVNEDEVRTVGVEFGVDASEDVTVDAGYDYSWGRGKVHVTDITSTTAVETDPPPTRNKLHTLRLGLAREVRAGLVIQTQYRYENYNVSDFAVEHVPIVAGRAASGAPAPNAIYLGDSLQGYVGHAAFLGVKAAW